MTGLFTGLATIDMQFLVDTYPDSNTKNNARQYGVYVGGPAANAAITFAYLGGTTTLASSIGRHPLSSIIHSELDAYSVQKVDFTPDSRVQPVVASVITSADTADRTIFSYKPDKSMISLAVYKQIEQMDFDVLLVDGFHMEACIEIAKIAYQKKIPVIFDGGSWKEKTEQLLPFVTVALCSEAFTPPACESPRDIISFLKLHKIQKGAISRGDKSILYFDENQNNGEIIIEPIKAVDTLGAGDILHGAFCYYYTQGQGFVESLNKASRTASKSCMFFGTRAWMNIS